MTLEELDSKLAKLEEARRITEAELATLNAREERARELEADRDALVPSYSESVPEALDGLSGEDLGVGADCNRRLISALSGESDLSQ